MTRPADAGDPRRAYLAWQGQWLGPWAVGDGDSGGRKVAEPPHPYRTCFQRDRDRIVHCSAFRRLDFKTQVFVPHEHDHFRTRMTHTLEVAQVARTLARALRLNEDLVEAAALAHDLGHPPFGHGGEAELDALMAGCGGFEHNRQSLRIVDYLEHPYPAFRGLNLTQATRECIARHQTRYDTPVSEEFDSALCATLEGQLVDLADEIAYTAADLEDALAAGWLTVERLTGLQLWRRAWETARRAMPDARAVHKRIRACKAVLNLLADDVIATTTGNIREADLQSPDDARRAGRRCVAMSPPAAESLGQMQDFLLNNVYLEPRNARQEQASRGILRELFALLTADPTLLPDRYRKRVDDEPRRVACDYIAGMTDRFCRNEHARLRR